MSLIRKPKLPVPARSVVAAVMLAMACASCAKKDDEANAADSAKDGGGIKSGVPDVIPTSSSMVFLSGEMEVLPGMKLRSEQKIEMLDGLVATRSPGGNSQGHIEMTDKEVCSIEYLSERERRVIIDEKQAQISMETGGAEPVETLVRSPLEGIPLIARRQKSGTWWYGPVEGEADPEMVNELTDMSARDMLVLGTYPKEPRTLGDSWEASLDSVRALLGTRFEATEGAVTMRLARLGSHEGQRCAEIAVDLQCKGTYAGAGAPMEMELALEGSILRSLNTFQDLKVALTGPMKLKSTPGEDTTVSMEGTVLYSLENHVSRE